ncbi:RluA family pseudouridine synthase [Fusobacterium perfoetens]|uniref:RluA family pseudouridine synthase n=1 Tax=Fusobacterium perfoetens TaxID=852 RepID=UPI000486580B|nr:RluA family pseudouridine synthase [Fusobacterium perfoetens]MCI6152319.1 RluA family pseudouridine synthase [Fusobacterium perfoetens]MDY3238177.1 RluA family pseudouridine synthase [Fusobacterium perfoetens]
MKNLSLKVKINDELMKFLIENLPGKNRNNIKSLLKNGQILVNGVRTSQFNYLLKEGDEVIVSASRMTENHLQGIKIIFEDDDIIVIEKPEGMLSIATDKERERTAYNIVKEYIKAKNPQEKLFIVHRLDKGTSGVMIFAKTEGIQQVLQTNWQNFVKERKYVAVVEGKVEKNRDTIISYLKENNAMVTFSSPVEIEGSKKAITHYEVLKRSRAYSLVEANIETGRKNQIRVHMQGLGHSIIGDKKYGAKTNPLRRLGLHARTIVFKHPRTNKILSFETKIPVRFSSMFKVK